MFHAHADAFGPKAALVADDDALMNTLITHQLNRRGFAVTAVDSGEAALSALEGDVFDLVVLDIRMQGLSGIEICHRIRYEMGLEDLPVIAFTAHREIETISHMRMAGFNDILFKPLSDKALDNVLEQACVALTP